MKKKTVAILMAAMLICGGAIGATAAWLTDSTTEVVNTFTYGNVDIELTEEKPTDQTAKMIPGDVIEKDPKVTVKAKSEPCYVFVEITPSGNYSTFFGDVKVNSSWTHLGDEGSSMIYYQEVTPSDTADWTAYILAGTTVGTTKYLNGAVTVLETVTKKDMDKLKPKGTEELPTLKFKAYAIQKANTGTVKEAWAKIKPTSTPEPEQTPAP